MTKKAGFDILARHIVERNTPLVSLRRRAAPVSIVTGMVVMGMVVISMAVVGSIVTGSAASAQERGTEAEQIACTPDVFRLCSALVPDEEQIIACLQSKRDQLSPACASAFAPALRRRTRQR